MEDRDVLIKESVLEDIGDALQEKLKTKGQFLPDQLGDKIRSIDNETWFQAKYEYHQENLDPQFFTIKVGV